MMHNKYSISVFWSDEDQDFIALSPEFPGLSAFGNTQTKAVKEAEKVLAEMLILCEEEGEKKPEPKTLPEHSGQFRIRLPKSLHTALALEAERQSVSLNSLIITYLSQALANDTCLAAFEQKISELKEFIGAACEGMKSSWYDKNTQEDVYFQIPAASNVYSVRDGLLYEKTPTVGYRTIQ